MNRYIIDDEGFLIVETKFGNLLIEQWSKGASVKFIENTGFANENIASHIEDASNDIFKIICLVQDE